MAKPFPMAAVVLPTASSPSVILRVFLAHGGHFGDAAGVVGDRSVGVDGHGDPDCAQHPDSGEAHAVEAGELVGDKDRGQQWSGGGRRRI